MEIEPIIDYGLGNSSYVLDLGDGQGLVIDPERDPAPYLGAAEDRGLRLRWVAETHLHSDFVSGSRELAAAGANLLAPADSELAFTHRPIMDGDEIDLGGLVLQVIATPGHTPEHVAYLLVDGSTPKALFSGGTLMAGGIARTDLVSPDLTEELARAAFRSIHQRLLVLPEDLPVFPTHGAGSFCSVAPTGDRVTTIGRERTDNPLLQITDEDEFVASLLGGLGTYPSYFLRLREVNQSGPVVYGTLPPELNRLSADDVEMLIADGAEVIDVRPVERFGYGHIRGSLSIELRSSFATWLGWVVDPDRPLVFVADPDQDLSSAVRHALNVGYENLGGYLDGGTDAWAASGRPLEQIELVGAGEITGDTSLVDVRQHSEWDVESVPGAINLEVGSIEALLGEVPPGAVTHCGSGQRAMTAASLIRRAGIADVAATSAGPTELARSLTEPA